MVRVRWVLVAIAVAAAVATSELALRVLGLPRQDLSFLGNELEPEVADVYEAHDELFWRLRPDTERYVANRLGLRGWLPSGDKHPLDLRIACVGDSCTFGLGVRYEDSYGVRLERALQHALPDRRVESVLAAVGGWSTYQDRNVYAREIAPLRPDITVLYVGAFNDAVPAIGLDDAQRGSWLQRLRIVRLLTRVLGPELGDRKAWVEHLRAGTAPYGRRVSLPSYRANVAALIALARAAGSAVVVVLPPYPEATCVRMPVLRDYRAATAAVAAEHGVATVDAQAAIDACQRLCPPEWAVPEHAGWPCFSDWCHPTALGHRLLAEALLPVLAHELGVPTTAAAVPARRGGVAIDAVEPSSALGRAGERVVVRGRGLASVRRAWIGDAWIAAPAHRSDTTLDLALPRAMPPGSHAVELLTAEGLVRAAAHLEVLPVPVPARWTRDGGRLRLEARLAGPPGFVGALWLGASLGEHPVATPFGDLALAGAELARCDALRDAPFRFDLLTRFGLAHVAGRCDQSGDCHLTLEAPAASIQQPVFVQGLVVDPWCQAEGALTGVAELAPPR